MTLRGIFAGHIRLFLAILVGIAVLFLLPHGLSSRSRGIIAWDAGSALYLVMIAIMFARCPPERMPANAEAQQDGEWTLFFLVVAGVTISFAAILGEFGSMKDLPAAAKQIKVTTVAVTLVLSWLVAQIVFALRYAHEYYSCSAPGSTPDGAVGSAPDGKPRGKPDGGLDFPSDDQPDYWDFVYFSIVLGMTFQVSDVQITSRKFRRLATLHGLLGFVFNTVIIALTVNLASGLL